MVPGPTRASVILENLLEIYILRIYFWHTLRTPQVILIHTKIENHYSRCFHTFAMKECPPLKWFIVHIILDEFLPMSIPYNHHSNQEYWHEPINFLMPLSSQFLLSQLQVTIPAVEFYMNGLGDVFSFVFALFYTTQCLWDSPMFLLLDNIPSHEHSIASCSLSVPGIEPRGA